jgi:heat shock protein HtpX
MGLRDALLKLEKGVKFYPMEANHATAHLFIVTPLSGEGITALFSTHPPIQERVRRLQNMTV